MASGHGNTRTEDVSGEGAWAAVGVSVRVAANAFGIDAVTVLMLGYRIGHHQGQCPVIARLRMKRMIGTRVLRL